MAALYLRPSAILVRPGNPQRIEDFPDLLRSGIGVTVVNGSGQKGLWEDIAGTEADIVHVSQPYRIYRRSSVALTAGGAANSVVQAFVGFLQSAVGAEVFAPGTG